MFEQQSKPLESIDSEISPESRTPISTWIRVGTIAAASALVGGLAAAWFYKTTLNRFRQAESEAENPDFGRKEPGTESDA